MRALVLCGAEVINYEQQDVLEVLNELTAGRGPDHCIEAVGMEAYRPGLDYWYDHAKQALRLQTGRPTAVREAVLTCRKGGTVAILGVFGGFVDRFPLGAVVNKALTIRSAQQYGQRYATRPLEHVVRGDVDPSYMITHRLPIEEGVHGYKLFKHNQNECLRVVFSPA